jgi:hypothetical protein
MERVVTAPDGRQYKVNAPDGATDDQIIDFVRSQTGPKEPPKSLEMQNAEAGRAKLPAAARYLDTAVRGLGRAFPFMDDAAAFGDTVIGRGEGDSFGQRYQSNLAQERAVNAVDDRDRPVLSYGGQVAGAVGLPVGAAGTATTMMGKIGAGAAIGAGYGAASGFGAGTDLADRGERAAFGAVGGGVMGGLAAPVVAGAKYAFGPIVQAGRGLANPAREAARRVYNTIAKSTAEGRGPSMEVLDMAAKTDAPLVLGDMAGEPGRALARSAANTSPEGREALQEVAQDRFAGQSGRVASFIEGLSGGKFDPAQFTTWLQKRARTRNAPLYNVAYREGETAVANMPDGLWTDDLAKLAQSPTFQKAMLDSVPRGADRAVARGGEPVRAPFVADKEGNIGLAPADASGKRALPSLEYWDNVKRELDAKIIALNQAGDKAAAADVRGLRSQLLGVLDNIAPTYKKARASAASFFRAEDAMEAGQNFVTMNKSADLAGARKAFSDMTSTERALFSQGYAAELAAQVSKVSDNQNVPVKSIFNSPLAREKAEIALGPKRSQELQTYLTVERTMDRLRTALGNSTTARQLAELSLAGGVGGLATMMDGGDMTTGGAAGLVTFVSRALAGKVDQRVARRVAELLASSDPTELQKAYTIVSSTPGLRSGFDSLDAALAKIGGTVAGGEAEAK